MVRLRRDDFLSGQGDYHVVLDLAGVDFSLEKLSNCSLWDAHRILHRQKAALSAEENAFLVPSDRRSFWSFYSRRTRRIQKISMKNCELFPQLWRKDGIFLMENVIAEFCRSRAALKEESWWLYAAKHPSVGVRIVAGVGRGIVLSRFLGRNDVDAPAEALKTIVYLKRFGLEGEVDVITPLEDVAANLEKNKFCKVFRLRRRHESALMEFLSRNRTIERMFVGGNALERLFGAKRFCLLQCCCFSAFVIGLLVLGDAVDGEKKLLAALEKSRAIGEKNLVIEVNADNFTLVKQMITDFGDCGNPIGLLTEISRLCGKNKIQPERMWMENSGSAKLKTLLELEQFEELQKFSHEKLELRVEKLASSQEEYEELGINKKLGAIICIKAK
jgi:hypothetical protein